MKKGEVHIQITDQLAIGGDSRQWIVKYRPEKKDAPGEYSDWVDKSFYGDLNQLIRALKERILRETEIHSATELYEAAEEIDQLFSKKHFKVVSEVTIR